MKKSNWTDRLKLVEQRAQSFQHAPLSCPYRPRLSRPWQPASVWRLFPRQSAAIAFSQTSKQDVHVFALEKEQGEKGQRIYLVTSYSELWHYYRTFRQSLMHCYEVIPEGAVCKLYFDLEFHRPSNPGREGRAMVALLIQYVCEKLEELYNLTCSSKNILNLDSSTAEKFSRHLIFILPDAAFKDNGHVGRFICAILQPALNSLQRNRAGAQSEEHRDAGQSADTSSSGPIACTANTAVEVGAQQEEAPQSKRKRIEERDLSFLLVKNKEGQHQLFVDLGVYTKNRNFRLYKSSKLGKNAAFMVAEDNMFISRPAKHVSAEEDIFLSSLISNVSFTGQRILTWGVSEKKSCPGTQSTSFQRAPYGPDFAGGHLSSPHEEVDEFVVKLVCRDGIQGSIRRWTLFEAEQLLVYDILGFRWCHNVGRHHKSNNIMILVDLRDEVWYQRCHDPECRAQNFRSSSYPLPQEICISFMLREDEEDQLFLMDAAGNIELGQRTGPVSEPGEQDRARAQEQGTEAWGGWPDDLFCLEALEEVERSVEKEVPDELLVQAVAECERRMN